MSTYPTYTDKKCPKWEDSHSGDISLYGKCCGTCMKQVRCKDNPDDYFVEDMSSKKSPSPRFMRAMKPETKILSFPTTPEVEAAARRIVDKVGATYFDSTFRFRSFLTRTTSNQISGQF